MRIFLMLATIVPQTCLFSVVHSMALVCIPGTVPDVIILDEQLYLCARAQTDKSSSGNLQVSNYRPCMARKGFSVLFTECPTQMHADMAPETVLQCCHDAAHSLVAQRFSALFHKPPHFITHRTSLMWTASSQPLQTTITNCCHNPTTMKWKHTLKYW